MWVIRWSTEERHARHECIMRDPGPRGGGPVALPMLGQLAFGAACLTFFMVAAWLMVREWRRPAQPRRAARDWDRLVDEDWRE